MRYDSANYLTIMKEPGLDNRYRDQKPPKAGEIRQKRSDALNGNLSKPVPGFRSDATVGHMRDVTGKVGLKAIAKESKKIRGK